jgi:hypothetical protein
VRRGEIYIGIHVLRQPGQSIRVKREVSGLGERHVWNHLRI